MDSTLKSPCNSNDFFYSVLREYVMKISTSESKLTDGKSVIKEKSVSRKTSSNTLPPNSIESRDDKTNDRVSQDTTIVKQSTTQESFDNLPCKASKQPIGTSPLHSSSRLKAERARKTLNYVRRKSVVCTKYLDYRSKIQKKILKAQLESAEAEKRAALMAEEINQVRLDITKLEYVMLKRKLQ